MTAFRKREKTATKNAMLHFVLPTKILLTAWVINQADNAPIF